MSSLHWNFVYASDKQSWKTFGVLCIFLDCWFPQDPYIYISHLPLFHSLFLPFFLCSFPLPLPFLLLDTDSCAISTSFWLTFFSNCQQVQLSTSFEWFLLQGIAIGSNSGSSDQFFLRQICQFFKAPLFFSSNSLIE